MQLTPLSAISPIDGRYFDKTAELSPLFSEYGLFRFRLLVEIRWIQTLANEPQIKEIKPFSKKTQQELDTLVKKFSINHAKEIKKLEAKTNHDIKAIEYFLKKKLKTNLELNKSSEFIHFACTSEDINNLAYALMLKETREKYLLSSIEKLIDKLKKLAKELANFPMLARTHGQAAIPTTMGKELANFAYRLMRQKQQFAHVEILGKFNGAVGNYNAHCIAYPKINWQRISKKFVEKLGLTWNPYTTQIEPHDYIAEYCDALKRINTILINLCADMWGYISLGYFTQKLKAEETGSSTMPHKINPIDFENAEGNLSLANSLNEHFARILPNSRWQRDLRDSTLLRNLGVGFTHSLIAYKNLLNGLEKIDIDESKLSADLNQHWEILAEAIQTILRKNGTKMPYEKLKKLTRGKKMDEKMLHQFIHQIKLSEEVKQQLLKLVPANYLGYASKLAKEI
ncbi:MAG: adenylosuccinate lyase [Rickettsiella sp.]|nr:adenylosuccinate lyase [Rickettsiella sp.]